MVATVFVVADLSAGHLARLPAPVPKVPVLRASAVHILAEGCGGSQRIKEHLLARGAAAEFREKVVYLEDKSASPADRTALKQLLAKKGFGFELVSAESLAATYGAEAAPALLISDGAGMLRYSGGYTDEKRSNPIRDVELLQRVDRGESPEPLPIFGCAVSRQLTDEVDPPLNEATEMRGYSTTQS